jgi:hypothetical protein
VIEPLAQLALFELAYAGLGDLLDKLDRVWQPPLREAGLQVRDKFFLRSGCSFFLHHDG